MIKTYAHGGIVFKASPTPLCVDDDVEVVGITSLVTMPLVVVVMVGLFDKRTKGSYGRSGQRR